MEYKVEFLEIAKQDISHMIDTLIDEYPDAALRKYEKILATAKLLQSTPYMYEECHRHKPYHRFVVEDYLVFYKVFETKKVVHIYRVLYCRRNVELL